MASTVISARPAADFAGRIVDERFPLLERLGGTEQSSVFLTELDGYPAQKAAIKLIPANVKDAETRIARWETTSTLSHPHLIRLFQGGRCELDGVDLLYVVTEYSDEVLSEVLRERPLTPGEAWEMLGPVLEALTWLNSRKLMHGHLKPSNIMVAGDRLKLSADRLHAVGEPGSTSAWSGKYSAPEAALENRSPAGDMWSLGVVVVEALTQQRPRWDRFAGGEPAVPHSIPQPFFDFAWQCLQVDPARRLSLSGARELLEGAGARQPAREIAPAPPAPERASRARFSRAWFSRAWFSRGEVRLAGLALVIGLMIAAGVIGWARASHHRASPPSPVQNTAQNSVQSSVPATQTASVAPVSRVSRTPSAPPISRTPSPTPATASSGSSVQAHRGSVVKGAVLTQGTPDIPEHIQDGIQGHFYVRVALQVDADGKVTNATLDEPGPSRYFANQALKTAQTWTFQPAEVGGSAVASQWALLFRFGRDGITVTPTETGP